MSSKFLQRFAVLSSRLINLIPKVIPKGRQTLSRMYVIVIKQTNNDYEFKISAAFRRLIK